MFMVCKFYQKNSYAQTSIKSSEGDLKMIGRKIELVGQSVDFPYGIGTVSFPAMCAKCLGTTDLTWFISKWKMEHRPDPLTTVKETSTLPVPICQSCKMELVKPARAKYAKIFAVVAPICWSVLFVLFILGFSIYGDFFALLLAGALALSPLYVLILVINPPDIFWPVSHDRNHIYFVNEVYAKLFYEINSQE